jgi:arylsulfatase A-like enzyme
MNSNVLFIVADDLNSWIGALGRNPDVKTPNIDKLATRGTLFSHTYCAAPYCNASRMSVFTGCLPTTTGIYANEPLWDTPGRRTTLVEVLRDAGYYTFGAGKVFHGAFDYTRATRDRKAKADWCEVENRPYLWNDFCTNIADPLPDNRPLNKLFDFGDFASVPPIYHHFDWGPLPDDRIDLMPDAKVARAVTGFLSRAPKEPFFCAAGLYKPHLPWHVPSAFFNLYDPQNISLPLVKSNDLDDVPPIGRDWALSPPDHEIVTGRNLWCQAVHGYLASISYCDHMVGEIVAALDASGLSERTTIILWGDNGFHLGEKLHWRKFALWEEATRVPLIVVPPDIRRRGHRIHEPVSLIDLFPTILQLCNVSSPSTDGESLCPLLVDGAPARETPAIMTWGKGNHSIRTSKWRFTRYSDGSEELYDHRIDPYEWTNIAGIEDVKSVTEQISWWIPRDD